MPTLRVALIGVLLSLAILPLSGTRAGGQVTSPEEYLGFKPGGGTECTVGKDGEYTCWQWMDGSETASLQKLGIRPIIFDSDGISCTDYSAFDLRTKSSPLVG